MKVGFLITGRLKSTRLPKKLLLKVNDLEVLRWMIRRVKLGLDNVVLCTSTNEEDNPLLTLAEQEGISSFRGSEEDVIKRLYEAAREYGFDFVINITADCPLVSFEYIDKVIEAYKDTNADLIRTLDLPHGLFLYGIKVSALKEIIEIKKEKHTEVWGKLFTDTGLFDVYDLVIPNELKRPNYRLTLDYPEDFDFFKRVFEDNGVETYKMKDIDILKYLDKYPEVVAINEHCEELYKARWTQQNNIKL
jgi:spore coat polysaccharide biosynthesis protein SpsF